MWLALVPALLAADPAAPTTGATAPAEGGRVGLEAGLTLAVPLPTAGLGPGPGLRLLGEYAVIPRLGVGGELFGRVPGGAIGTLEHDRLGDDLEWRSGLTVLGGGPRVSYTFGPLDGFHGRAALAGGLAWVAQDTVTQVGRTHDAVLTGWIQPEVGGLVPLGPGDLTFDLLVPIAPAPLLVLGDAPGGTGVGLAVGYRFGL